MIWDKLVGQSTAIDTLRRSAAAGRLAHALLFVGPLGVGKRSAAQLLATALLCQRVREEAGRLRRLCIVPNDGGGHASRLSERRMPGRQE